MAGKFSIAVGDQVYLEDGAEEVGAVRDVGSTPNELVVYIENGGDFSVPAEAIRAAHSGKVILREEALSRELRKAIRHAHDSEERPSG